MAHLDIRGSEIAKRKWLLWVLAVLITLAAAVYQRMTGPTYPARGSVSLNGQTIGFKLPRTEVTGKDVLIAIPAPDTSLTGFIKFRRLKSYDEWRIVPLRREGSKLIATLPSQPPAGKIVYFVFLNQAGQPLSLTGEKPVVLRYKGHVPAGILIPHIFFMFLAMLFSNRTLLEALVPRGNARPFMLWTIGLFLVGGFILGPLVQKHAFGALWTGIPFGYDLTDNKTLIAMAGWLLAWWQNRGERTSRGWIIFAALLMMAVYLIPHSVLGSELDYTKLPQQPGR